MQTSDAYLQNGNGVEFKAWRQSTNGPGFGL
jgi:hypothetical protein